MLNLKKTLNQYFWPIVIAAVILTGGVGYWIAGRYQEHKVDSSIQQLQTESRSEVNTAVENETRAANTSIERRSEDAVRDRVVRPKLENARARSDRSKLELEKAQEQFNEKPQIPHANTDTWAANCARLKRVFPGETFEYCQR